MKLNPARRGQSVRSIQKKNSVSVVLAPGEARLRPKVVRVTVKNLSALLRVADAELAEADEAIRTAESEHGAFVSALVHELRTPMNSVMGHAQLMEMRSKEPETRESARSILRAGKHLLSLISELLEVAKSESNPAVKAIGPVRLTGVIRQAVEILEPIALKSKIKIEVIGAGFKGVQVLANRQRLLQVVINLLSNAVKYNHPGGSVELCCSPEIGGMRRIEIKDSGSGIETMKQSLLFEPFHRLGKMDIEGTGLGLVISRQFIELMGGNLGLVQSTSAGTTFYVDLPRTPAAARKI